MNDIHAIIAAARRELTDDEQPTDWQATLTLHRNAISMAEALVSADRFLAEGRYADAAVVIGDCIDKIVKEGA